MHNWRSADPPQRKHLSQYRIFSVCHYLVSFDIDAARGRFYICHGREGGSRKDFTIRIFEIVSIEDDNWAQNFGQRLKFQRKKYQNLAPSYKNTYFNAFFTHRKAIYNYEANQFNAMKSIVHQQIVNVIIAIRLWHDDGMKDSTQASEM